MGTQGRGVGEAFPVPVGPGMPPVGKIPVGRRVTVVEGVTTGGHGTTELVGCGTGVDDVDSDGVCDGVPEGTTDEEEGVTEGVEEGVIEGVPEDLTWVNKAWPQPLPG